MKQQTFLTTALLCSLVAIIVLPAQVSAQQSRGYGRGLYGDWNVTMQYNEMKFESILAFGRDSEGKQTGQWISFWGISDLKDVKLEDGKLTFEQVRTNREGQTTTSKFAGTIEEGKLSGTISSDRGDSKVEGKRAPRTSRAVGNWQVRFKVGERQIVSNVVITTDEEGELKVDWKSNRAEHEITDVQYERGKLTFKRKTKIQDREWESTFDGTLERDGGMTAVIKSERGEVTAEAKRIGAAAIGTWNLEIASEQGNRKQRLKINPDLSGIYGAMAVKKINPEDEKVSFKIVLEFGENKFEMDFTGKIEKSKMTGELKTSRGTFKVTGTKAVRTSRRRRTN